MSTLLTRYTFLQETEWAGRSVYRVRDDQAGRELYLIRERTQDSTIACSHPALPTFQPLTAESDVRWIITDGVQGESLESLREKRVLSRSEIRAALGGILGAVAKLSALNPPLVPGTLEPDCIMRDEAGQWKLDLTALAFTREARLSPGIPAGINPFGRLLYWLVTGESLRHGITQVPHQQGVTPMLYFMVMRCLGHAYSSLSDVQLDLDRLWEDQGFLLLIRDLGRDVGSEPAGLPDPLVQRLIQPAMVTAQPAVLPLAAPDAPTQQAGEPPQPTPEGSQTPAAAEPNRAWGPAPPPVHLRRTVEPEESQAPTGRLRSRRTALRLPYLAAGAALLLVAGISAILFWPRSSSPSLAPESTRPVAAVPSAAAPSPAVKPAEPAVPEQAVDPAEVALLTEPGASRRQPVKPDEPMTVAPARPAILRPSTPPPPFPALQPGSHQSLDMAAGGSPTWISLNGRWIGYAYIYYSSGRQFISMDGFNALFGRSLTWAENGNNSYAIFENGARLITSDGTRISPTRLWLKLTPEMQQWLGLQVQAVDDWGLHFRSLR